MTIGAVLGNPTTQIFIAKALDIALLYLSRNPEADEQFQRSLARYKAARSEGREMTDDEIAAVKAERKALLASLGIQDDAD